MLKVIIVDDERVQREGIFRHLSWQDYNMCVVGCAADGIEALELVRMHTPDILITDVKMPKMDGLELSKKAKELSPKIKIMIISGYEEFEIAKTAIGLNACAYILKPLDIDEMGTELAKIGAACLSEYRAEKEILDMKSQLIESKTFLVDKFIKDLIYGNMRDESIIIKRADFLSIPHSIDNYRVVLMQIDNKPNEQQEGYHLQVYYNILKHINEVWSNIHKGFSTQTKDSEFVFLIFEDITQADVPLTLKDIKNDIGNMSNATITFGISNVKNSIIEISAGYLEAETAVRQKFYLGNNKVIYYQDIVSMNDSYINFDELYKNLITNVEIGNVDKVENILEDIFQKLSNSLSTSKGYVKAFCFRVMSDIYRALYEMNERMESIFGEEDLIWGKIYRFDTIPDVKQWVTNIIIAVTRYIYNKKTNRNTNVIKTITQVLEEDYGAELSIEGIAKRVHLTPNYICNLFKENVGESIIDYLTKIRIKHAMQLLSQSSDRIYEIAEKTGFNSTTYFSIVFKNKVGMSPKEYRDFMINGGHDNG